MTFRLVVTLGITLLPATLWCAPQVYSTQEQLAKVLAPAFAPYVRKFNRPVYLFHGTKNKWIPATVYLGAQAAKAWDKKYSGSDMAGGGLYLATEPATSRPYGDTIYAFKTIPENFRFLDLSSSGMSFPYAARNISPELLRASMKLKCKFWSSTLAFASANCLAFRKALYQSLGVSAHFYGYSRKKTKHPEEKDNTLNGAFVASSLQGLDYRASLDSSELDKSFKGLLKAEAANSIENFQSRFYLGLNPQHASERALGNFGKVTARELQRLGSEIASAPSMSALEEQFKDNSFYLEVLKNREKIVKLLELSPAQLREIWLEKLAEISKKIEWDDSNDPNGDKFTAYVASSKWDTSFVKTSNARGFASLELYDSSGDPRAVKPSQKCIAFLENYLTTVTDKTFDRVTAEELKSAAQKVMRAKNPHQAIKTLAAQSENYYFNDAISTIFNAPACAITKEHYEKLTDEEQDDDYFAMTIYHRPSEPSQRQRRFFEIMDALKSPFPKDKSKLKSYGIQLHHSLMEFSLLDPAKTTSDTKKWATELMTAFRDSTLNYNYEDSRFHYDLRYATGEEFFYLDIADNRETLISTLRGISWKAYILKHFPGGNL